ncbi:unnamed protein product [Callosobruchus maculatus]|uniref:DUF4794 domain-containing protein n=1 Tax=Callosobruchus maculatus TaxID=64391 RepID=A0A653DXS7_CALMS|nr:unnamed protein product [Callosobruchus maculatus]
MKIPVLVLCAAQIVLCEVPPPYPRKGFRPHQPLLLPLLSQVQSFVPPSQKFTNGRIINGGSPFRPTSLQQSYGPPSKLQNQPQSTYGPPSYQKPSSTYNVPSKIQSQPDVIYGLPGIAQNPIQSRPQTTYGPPSGSQKVPSQLYGTPQTTYGAPNHQVVSSHNFGGLQQIQSLPQAFRPLPPENSASQSYGPPKQSEPQTTYGAPNHQVAPSQNFGAPQQIQSLPQAFRPLPSQNTPSQSYGPPKQTAYGPPSSQIAQGTPSNVQRPSHAFGVQNSHATLSQLYGTPSKVQSLPQTTYGTPDLQVEPLQTPRQAFSVQNLPKTSHGVPVAPSQAYGAPSKVQSQPQTTYGVPSVSNEAQSVSNITPAPQKSLAQTYGAPPRTPEIETLERLKNQQFSNVIPTSQHLPLKEPGNFGRFLQGLPLREAEDFRSGVPSQQYLPVREAENFNQGYPRSLNQNQGYSRNLNQQYLPVKDAQNFKQGFERNTAIANSFQGDFGNIFPAQNTPRTHTTVDVQKVDVMSVIPLDNNYPENRNSNYPQPGNPNINPTSEFGTETPKRYPEENQTVGQVDNEKRNVAPQNGGYDPPVATTTEKPVLKRPTKPKQIPTTAPPEVDTEQGNEEDENEAPQRDETPDDGQSNVAIATAVAGGGSRHFYLLQPDGRLQRVTLEKTQETGDAANEYTANYLFQNIQPEPNGVYAPLISLVNK